MREGAGEEAVKSEPSLAPRYLCVLCQDTFSQLCSFKRHKREVRCPKLKLRRREQEGCRPTPAKKRGREEVQGVNYFIILYLNL